MLRDDLDGFRCSADRKFEVRVRHCEPGSFDLSDGGEEIVAKASSVCTVELNGGLHFGAGKYTEPIFNGVLDKS